MSLSPKARSYALSGALLSAVAAARCFALSYGLFPQLLLPLLLLDIGAFALWLLRREGYDGDTLAGMVLVVGLALFVRAFLLPHETLDYQDFLSRWVQHFRDNGGFAAIKDPVGNYNVPYLYLLALLPKLPFSDLYGIKLFSILFDVLLAWGGLRLTRRLTQDKRAPLAAFSALLLLPTVVLNGACWGQCDSVWGALGVLALACALEDKPWRSAALLGLAFAFKLQAIFLVPLWLALWLGKKVAFRHLWAFPAAFAAAILPALLVGKPLADILGVYVGQASDSAGWGVLNYNSPSAFALIPYYAQPPRFTARVGIAAAFVFMAAVLALLIRRRDSLQDDGYVLAGAALSLGIPFFLPYMHERYFFLGGMLAVVLDCAKPRFLPAAMGAELASLGGYHAYLTQRYFLFLTLFGVSWSQLLEGLLMFLAIRICVAPLLHPAPPDDKGHKREKK